MNRLFKNQEKELVALSNKKGRVEQNAFIVEGIKPLDELSSSLYVNISKIIVDSAKVDSPEIVKVLQYFKSVEIFTTDNFAKITTLEQPEGVMAICKIPPKSELELFLKEKKRVLAIYEINDPGNLGTIIRTACWFGLDGIILIGNSTDEYAPKTVRSSMGAVSKIEIIRESSLDKIISLSGEFNKIGSYLQIEHNYVKKSASKTMLFLGSEAHGLPVEVINSFDSNYLIKGDGNFESLNVTVAAGIMLNDIFG